MNEQERRDIRTEVRAVEVDGSPHIVGKSPVFSKLSEDLGGWREVIEPTAFDSVMASSPDVRGRFDHDLVLGRTKSGTLNLIKESDGISYDITINPDDPEAMAAFARVKRGDVDGASFMFIVDDDRWEKDASGEIVRHVITAAALLDVGPVAYPAYPDATAAIRSRIKQFQEQPAPSAAEAAEVQARQKARSRTLDLISKSIHP